jgi:hypothetical protein
MRLQFPPLRWTGSDSKLAGLEPHRHVAFGKPPQSVDVIKISADEVNLALLILGMPASLPGDRS